MKSTPVQTLIGLAFFVALPAQSFAQSEQKDHSLPKVFADLVPQPDPGPIIDMAGMPTTNEFEF